MNALFGVSVCSTSSFSCNFLNLLHWFDLPDFGESISQLFLILVEAKFDFEPNLHIDVFCLTLMFPVSGQNRTQWEAFDILLCAGHKCEGPWQPTVRGWPLKVWQNHHCDHSTYLELRQWSKRTLTCWMTDGCSIEYSTSAVMKSWFCQQGRTSVGDSLFPPRTINTEPHSRGSTLHLLRIGQQRGTIATSPCRFVLHMPAHQTHSLRKIVFDSGHFESPNVLEHRYSTIMVNWRTWFSSDEIFASWSLRYWL